MIIEPFKSDYNGYEEENYDYLFKRKSKEERQQKKIEKKQKREDKRQEKKSGDAPKKHPLLGNFGLFNKNKNKEKAKTGTTGSAPAPGSSGKKEAGKVSDSAQEKTEGTTTPANESSAQQSEDLKLESKELDKNEKPKEAGVGALVGVVFLGLTILLAGYAIYKADKKPISELQPLIKPRL
ncbi:MAG: hypothetical protein EPN85_05760 [Bacteroidetes bacterium]|nr:MAG: hypothetical protein EPN85_05760 [Bacteroidota bacterium]